ncbi:MAG: TetR/AcrR family transcriptional regulator [Chloroflexota bacterium]
MSRSNSAESPYHHGDLRNTLIKAGVQMLADVGEGGMSMRKLAKTAGVSHNAPYMHFADKEALLAAIAEEGFLIMGRQIEEAINGAGQEWQAQLHGGCNAYVRFALDYPNHFNVMFRGYPHEKYAALHQISMGSLAVLGRVVAQGQASGHLIQRDIREMATQIWFMLHGISTILVGHTIPLTIVGDRTTEEVVSGSIQALLDGLANNSN